LHTALHWGASIRLCSEHIVYSYFLCSTCVWIRSSLVSAAAVVEIIVLLLLLLLYIFRIIYLIVLFFSHFTIPLYCRRSIDIGRYVFNKATRETVLTQTLCTLQYVEEFEIGPAVSISSIRSSSIRNSFRIVTITDGGNAELK